MEVIYLYYDSAENIFYDECGRRIDNIFDVVREKDLYIFRQDPGYTFFPYHHEPGVWCEIVDIDETPCDDDIIEEFGDPFMDEELEQAYIRWGLERMRI